MRMSLRFSLFAFLTLSSFAVYGVAYSLLLVRDAVDIVLGLKRCAARVGHLFLQSVSVPSRLAGRIIVIQ